MGDRRELGGWKASVSQSAKDDDPIKCDWTGQRVVELESVWLLFMPLTRIRRAGSLGEMAEGVERGRGRESLLARERNCGG